LLVVRLALNIFYGFLLLGELKIYLYLLLSSNKFQISISKSDCVSLGKIGIVQTVATVANALCDFDGIRRFSLPMKRKMKSQTNISNILKTG